MRAEHARVEALALYSRWTTRQIDAVREVAAELGVDLVDLDDIEDAARRYGRRITRELVPGAAATAGRALNAEVRSQAPGRASPSQ